jgi:hypothetical protein
MAAAEQGPEPLRYQVSSSEFSSAYPIQDLLLILIDASLDI